MKISIVDYNTGNCQSILNMIQKLGYESEISSTSETIINSDIIILPGVGSFDRAIYNLNDKKLIETIKFKVNENKSKILGICLGMQILCQSSAEGNEKGLGYFDLSCEDFSKIRNTNTMMGWSYLKKSNNANLVSKEDKFYFLHRFFCPVDERFTIAVATNKNIDFSAIIKRNNVFGVQFHPERSHKFGLKFLKNFIEF